MLKRVRFFAFLLVFVATLPISAQVKWSRNNYVKTLKEADTAHSFVLIDFYATWCVPCKMLDAMTWSKAKVGDFLIKNHIYALKLDAEKEGLKPAGIFKIRVYPTVILVNGKGEEIGRFMGVKAPDGVIAFLRKTLKDPRTESQLRKAVKDNPGNLGDAYALAHRMTKVSPDAIGKAEIRGLLDIVIKGDPRNTKGLGAQALADRVALGLTETFGRKTRYLELIAGTSFASGHVPNLFKARPDPEITALSTDLSKAAGNYIERLIGDCTTQLAAALKTVGAMKSPNADPAALLQAEYFINDGNRYTHRGLSDAFYLFMAAVTKNPMAYNNCAWYFYRSQSHLDLALKLARESAAVRQAPNVEDTLAHILFSKGEKKEAFKIEQGIIVSAKKSHNKRAAALYQKALDSWKSGVADHTFAPTPKSAGK